MNLRHPLWLPWGMGGSVQAGVSGVETRAGLLGGAKCLDLYVLEAEGTRAADKLNMAGGWGVGGRSLRCCPGLRPSMEWMAGPLPETESLGEMTSGYQRLCLGRAVKVSGWNHMPGPGWSSSRWNCGPCGRRAAFDVQAWTGSTRERQAGAWPEP